MHASTITSGLCAALFAVSALASPVVDQAGKDIDAFTTLSDLESTINSTYDLPSVNGFAREEIAAIFADEIERASAELHGEALFASDSTNSTSTTNGTLTKRDSRLNEPSGLKLYTFTGPNCSGRGSIQPNLHYGWQTPAVISSIWISRGLGWDEQMDFSRFGGWHFNPVSCGQYLNTLSRMASRGCHNIQGGAQCLRLWHY